MKAKNTIALFVTVMVLIVLVSVATYAYFSASVNTNSVTYVNTTTPAGVATFTSTGNTATLNVTANLMLKEAANNSTAKISNTATITATMKSAQTGPVVFCSYHIYFKFDTTAGSSYTPSTGLGTLKEFSIQAANTCKVGASGTCNASTLKPDYNETQIDSTAANGATGMDLGTYKIYSQSSSENTVITTTLTMKVYNVNLDQANIQNKTYIGKFYIGSVVC